jgi:hypothetical protein
MPSGASRSKLAGAKQVFVCPAAQQHGRLMEIKKCAIKMMEATQAFFQC